MLIYNRLSLCHKNVKSPLHCYTYFLSNEKQILSLPSLQALIMQPGECVQKSGVWIYSLSHARGTFVTRCKMAEIGTYIEIPFC